MVITASVAFVDLGEALNIVVAPTVALVNACSQQQPAYLGLRRRGLLQAVDPTETEDGKYANPQLVRNGDHRGPL